MAYEKNTTGTTLDGIRDVLCDVKTALENLEITLQVGDVEIGAVEIKDGVTDSRAAVVAGRLAVDGSGVTQPVSLASVPLAPGAATEAGQTTALSALEDIAENTANAATAEGQSAATASLAAIDGKLPALEGGRVPVVLPPGGGSLTDNELRAAAVPVTIDGAATEATLAELAGFFTGDTITIQQRDARHMDERRYFESTDANLIALSRRAGERMGLTDRRGSTGRGLTR